MNRSWGPPEGSGGVARVRSEVKLTRRGSNTRGSYCARSSNNNIPPPFCTYRGVGNKVSWCHKINNELYSSGINIHDK